MARGLRFPEGPIALADGSVLFVELAAGRLSRVSTDGEVDVVAELGGSPNGAAIGPDGRVFVCNNGGVKFVEQSGKLRPAGNLPDPAWIDVVDLGTGTTERLYDRCADATFRHCNDLVFDAHGGFYFTDSGKTTATASERGFVYYARADGSDVRRVASALTSPNGVGISPDGATLYVSETPTARLWAWDIVAPGVLRKLKQNDIAHGGRFVIGSANFQRFDSLAVTASGKIVVGTLTNGGLSEIWPDGSHMRHHPLPDGHVTNVAFGGADLRTAFVTLAGAGMLVALDWHEPGLRLNHQPETGGQP
ncbi:MAG: SMP-30/gluconolactonase/LRE family protein [Ilumatobacteraceae bacterium]